MSKINRIRLVNLNYNDDAFRIEDETFDLGGENTLFSLRNGGGKTVLVQMLISLFVNKSFRNFEKRPFAGYFKTKNPTFILTEWMLDHGQGLFLVGMMVRKAQRTEEDQEEELDILTFTGSYGKEGCNYDLDRLPVLSESGNKKVLRGYVECRGCFEELKKQKDSDFCYYDPSQSYQRKQYFQKLKEYQIDHKEWETIMKKVNIKESGLSELFVNARDERGLIEKWFLEAVQSKLNQDHDRIWEFRRLARKLIERYVQNETNIRRKAVLEKYLEDSEKVSEFVERYREQKKSEIARFIIALDEQVSRLEEGLGKSNQRMEQLKTEIRMIYGEQHSYRIYQYQEQLEEKRSERLAAEQQITVGRSLRERAEKELCLLECARMHEEVLDFEQELKQLEERILVLKEQKQENREEVSALGKKLYSFYRLETRKREERMAGLEEEEKEITKEQENVRKKKEEWNQEILRQTEQLGNLKSEIGHFDRVEADFNRRYAKETRAWSVLTGKSGWGNLENGLCRNILGEYEEGLLPVLDKKMEEGIEKVCLEITRETERRIRKEEEAERIVRQIEEQKERLRQNETEQKNCEEDCRRLEEEKKRRLILMRYVDAPERELEDREALLGRFERKCRELERHRDEFYIKMKRTEQERERLKQGIVVELPETVREYFREKEIDFTYGMEWLRKNGYEDEKNKEFVEENPLLPYSILVDETSMRKLSECAEEIYTNFPIPVVLKRKLSLEHERKGNGLVSFGDSQFFVIFNKKFLNPGELRGLLAKKEEEIQLLERQIQGKKEELQKYEEHKNEIARQEYLAERLEEKRKEAARGREEEQKLIQELEQAVEKKNSCEKEAKEAEEKSREKQKQLPVLERRRQDFLGVREEYERYLQNKKKLERLGEQKKRTKDRLDECRGQEQELQRRREETKERSRIEKEAYKKNREKLLSYRMYENEESWKEEDEAALEARFLALTEETDRNMEGLLRDEERARMRCEKKKDDLKQKNKYGFQTVEYVEASPTEKTKNLWEEKRESAQKTEDAANELANRLERAMEKLEGKVEREEERLLRDTGSKEMVEKQKILHTNFEERLSLKRYEQECCEKELEEKKERHTLFLQVRETMAEYEDFPVIPGEETDFFSEEVSREELRNIQGGLRRDLRMLHEVFRERQSETEREIRRMSKRKEYEDDFFEDGFVNLLNLVPNVRQLNDQIKILERAYETMLEKLKIDLGHVEKERKNVEELFLEYVYDVGEHLGKIDKNSTITIHGRSLKMLKIKLPQREENEAYYDQKMMDYVEQFIQWGMAAVKEERNLEEELDKLITTKKLFDEIVGMGNVEIRMYKIEEERERQISWSEVSANSGGEGFLSAFVILTCLLSYMRRDETDLFATGEEGKVLLMDNPFAQTNASHLLKPMMEMAKKTNTQLICLTGLGGDSIYNRFDNIYVLKLVDSRLRRGLQYVTGQHIKGNEIMKMDAAQFKMEQMELMDLF